MNPSRYLEVFFDEKDIPSTSFDLKDENGLTHFLTSEVVIEFILSLDNTLKEKIANKLRLIDFHNQSVIPFLRHIGYLMINIHSGVF